MPPFNVFTFKIVIDTVIDILPALRDHLIGSDGDVVAKMIAVQFNVSYENPEELAQVIKIDPNAKFKLFSILYYISQNKLVETQSELLHEKRIDSLLGKRDLVLTILSFTIIFGFFGVIAAIFATKLDTSDHDVLYIMVGSLIGGFVQVLNYFYGKSIGDNDNKK